MAARIGGGLPTPLGHRDAVVAGVFDHGHAMGAQPVLLPLAGVGGHVHRGLEAQARTDDADRQAEIAGRADSDLVAREEGAHRVAGEAGVVVIQRQQAGRQRQVFGVLEHLVDAAARLDRAGDRQVAVALEPQCAARVQPMTLAQHGLHLRQGEDVRLDDAAAVSGLRKHPGQVGGEARQACAGVGDVGGAQADIGQGFARGGDGRVEPADLAQGDQLIEQRIFRTPGGERLAKHHSGTPHYRLGTGRGAPRRRH